jgi:hypothetical protein
MTTTRRPPFFIVGVQRSGTTMLRLMMNAHPLVAVPFEWVFLKSNEWLRQFGDLSDPAAARRLLGELSHERFVRKSKLVEDLNAVLTRPITNYADVVTATLQSYADRRGKPFAGLKVPGYSAELDRIHALLPESKIVHIVRDGRDVAVSNRTVGWASSHIMRNAADWRWQVLVGRKLGGLLGPHLYHEVHFEELVSQPERELRRICEFLDLPYAPEMLEYPRGAVAEMPPDSMSWHRRSVTAPDTSRAGQWRGQLSAADVALFEEIAGDALAAFGYRKQGTRPRLTVALRRLYFTLVKRW